MDTMTKPKTELVDEMKQLRCSVCGATTYAACNCEVAYVSAAKYAATAIADNPEKNNKAIAEMLGVSEETVRRVRKSVPLKRELTAGSARMARAIRQASHANLKRQELHHNR